MNFKEALKNKRLYFDGGMGSLLQNRLKDIGQIPEELGITHPEIIQDIHQAYKDAGANIITTATFGASGYKLKNSHYAQKEIIEAAVKNAKAVKPDFVALDIGPVGALIGNLGEISFEEAYGYFADMVITGAAAGANLILIETMTDIYEAKAALLAAKENSNLPVIVSMTFEENGRTLTGSDPVTVVTILEALGVDCIGINCSTGPDKMLPVIETLLQYATVPLVVEPNAGLPNMCEGKTCYDISAEDFAGYMAGIAKKGAAILGGCCGTTPEYIEKTVQATREIPIPTIEATKERQQTRVATSTKVVVLGDDIRMIGECINPTTNAALKEELRQGRFSLIKTLALEQKKAGAHVLDINLGLPDIDEKTMMIEAVEAVSMVVDLPLQIDSSDPEVLEAVLRRCNGKPIINSVNGEARSLERILPLAKKYGACVLGLTMDEEGIPETAEKRLAIGRRILNEAKKQGIPKRDMLLDCLVLTASAQQKAVGETLKALEGIRAELQVPTVLGVSNISFGLPNRELMNRSFLMLAFSAGLNTPIMNPCDRGMKESVVAYRALQGYDDSCIDYVATYKDKGEKTIKEAVSSTGKNLTDIVVDGLKDEAGPAAEALLKELPPLEIVNNYLIPGLDEIGRQFETGEAFLPNLIFAAETVQKAFDVIKKHLSGDEQIMKGKILLATVAGDVHDIGKNILKVILENYGYEIHDLGKDVPVQTILDCIEKEGIKLVGLSALMTTTVKSMEETIKAIHKQYPDTKVMVGGAVLNTAYAAQIGADFYGKDAKAGVRIAKEIFIES